MKFMNMSRRMYAILIKESETYRNKARMSATVIRTGQLDPKALRYRQEEIKEFTERANAIDMAINLLKQRDEVAQQVNSMLRGAL